MKETVQQLDDVLAKCKVHFCLVSEQAAVNLLPVAYYRPKEAVLFVSHKMHETADQLQGAMEKAVPGIKVSRIAIKDPYDLNECRNVFLEALMVREDDQPVINVTGGTKIMAIGAVTAAYAAMVQTFYLNEQKNTISLIDPYKEDAQRNVSSIAMRMNLETYLAAYGFKVADSNPTGSLNSKEQSLVHELLSTPSMKEVVPRLNKLAVEAEKSKSMTASSASVSDDLVQAFDTLCDWFESAGHLQINGRTLRFPTEDDRFFVAGGWLERYVFNELSALKVKPVGNLVVRNPSQNELDAAFMHDGTFYIVECKTGNLYHDLEKAKEVVYKLETLSKVGGRKTRLVLVSYRELHPKAKERALKANIKVIEGPEVRRFREIMKGLISQ